MNLRAILLATCAALPCAMAGCSAEPSKPLGRPQNVLLVTLDTTRADRMSTFGYDRDTTPELDALASEGVVFDQAISTASITPPSHASIFTGLWPFHHGVRVIYAASGYKLHPEIPSLPSLLRDAGLRTGGFVSSFTASEYFGFDNGFDSWSSGLTTDLDEIFQWKPKRSGGSRAIWDGARHQRRSDETVDQAIEWIESSDDAFFCWVHLWDPHDVDLLPPDEWLERFPPRNGEEGRLGSYDAEVAFNDHGLGRLLQSLRESDRYDDTLVVVIADHGEGLGDHGWLRHHLLYEEQVRVPMVLKVPGGPRAKRVNSLVRNIDLFPTILSVMGLDVPKNDGLSLEGLMRDEKEDARLAYSDALNGWDQNAFILAVIPDAKFLYSVRDSRWKFIHHDRAEHESELFDLHADPRELNNLYSSDHPEAKRLKAFLDGRFSAGIRREPFETLNDPEVEEKLRSLGYIGGR